MPQAYASAPTHVQSAAASAPPPHDDTSSPTQAGGSRSTGPSPVPIVDIPDSDHEDDDPPLADRQGSQGSHPSRNQSHSSASGAQQRNTGPGSAANNQGASPSSRTITIPREPQQVTANVVIVFHSPDNRVWRVAEAVRAGVREVRGASVSMYQCPEILSPEEMERCGYRKAKEEFSHIPTLTSNKLHLLKEADALIMGFSPSFGQQNAESKALEEWMGELWINGSLHNCVGAVFTAASSQPAGSELAVMSTIGALMQFGMVVVGVPGNLRQPYGVMAGTDGPGGGPSPDDLEAARSQGRHVAEVALRLKRGARDTGGSISRN